MPVLSTNNPTLADFAARLDGNDHIVPDIVELLKEENEILEDMTFLEANEYTSHRTTVRSGVLRDTNTVPTGFPRSSPSGPASPVVATDRSLPVMRRTPSAMALATGSDTAP